MGLAGKGEAAPQPGAGGFCAPFKCRGWGPSRSGSGAGYRAAGSGRGWAPSLQRVGDEQRSAAPGPAPV